MASDTHTIDRIFEHLPETEKREILRTAGITDDRPNILRGQGGSYSDMANWMASHRRLITPLLLRKINLDDRQISRLLEEGDLAIGEISRGSTSGINIRVSISTSDENIDAPQDAVVMTDLTASSAIVCEMFVDISIANRPFDTDIEPPNVQVKRGSVEFAIGGGIFATGMALIVACGAGLVAAPIIGPLAGITIASAGVLDLAIGWKKQVAEAQKIEEETRILRMQNDHLVLTQSRREKELDIKIKELQLEKARSEIQEGSRFAYSGLVDRSTVQSVARQLGITEEYANHVLNRSLPKYLVLKQYTQGITVERTGLQQS